MRSLAMIFAVALLAASAAPAAGQDLILARTPVEGVSSGEVATAIRTQLREAGDAINPEVAAFYHARRNRPLWAPGRVRTEALWLSERLAERDPEQAVLFRDLAEAPKDPWTLAQLELRLSTAYAAQAAVGLKGGKGETFAFVDPQLAAGHGRGGQALRAAGNARDLQGHLEEALTAENPLYARFAQELARYQDSWSDLPKVTVPAGPDLGPGAAGPRLAALRTRLGLDKAGEYDSELVANVSAFQRAHGLADTGVADAETIRALNRGYAYYERILEANLKRAAALPADMGERFILVDAGAGLLWYYEHGEERLEMKVVVGKPSQPTPIMAGMVRYLLFNPYWNVPEDLVRTSIATKVLARGVSYIEEEGLEVLSDYTDDAHVLDPHKLNWKAIQQGQTVVRIRQKPGPKNMMGQVKLMLPNPLGVYLHDTPLRGDFSKSQRLASSGCVRLEDAMALARMLVGEGRVEAAADGSDQENRVDLKEPVPVYITYFTAMPTEDGVEIRPDVYGRDTLKVAGGTQTAAR